jgi:cell division protein FtsZ
MSNTDFGNISFDLPKNQSNVIKVIGIGGGGSNAVNHMYQLGIKGVDFVICNTDAQALENSSVPNKIQLGAGLTEGLGAGANPEVGEKAALESFEDIKGLLQHQTKMLFITAGMGGGTGTGAAPVIAKMAKELNILTVGIVTMPFGFEGKLRNEQATKGLENLRRNVDSLVVINNNKLREVYGNLGFKAGFSKADEVLSTAARGIAEVITHHYTQNIDLHDAKTVLSNSGTAIMGSAKASGENRAQIAISKALDSPLLNDNKITGAKNVLLLIVFGSSEITLDEIGEINDHIQNEAGHGANIIMGVGEDSSLEDAIAVTIIATGFNADLQSEIVHTEPKKIIHTLEDEQRAEQNLTPKATFSTQPLDFEMPIKKNVEATAVEENPVIKLPKENDLLVADEFIRSIEVLGFEEINVRSTENFIIHEKIDEAVEEKTQEFHHNIYEEKQVTLTFDLPKDNQEKQKSEEEIRAIEVNAAKEFIPFSESTSEGVKRYSLDDYMEMESMLLGSKPPVKKMPEKAVETDELFDFKTNVTEKSKPAEPSHLDPFDNPISEILKARADERRKKMKEFNYKFTGHMGNVDEIEREPAYKRMGIEVDNKPISSENKISRTTLEINNENEFTFRSNNSFLHDNVD